MIYTVELNFSDPSCLEQWSAWYNTYLQQLVTVPGLSTAQRFRAVTRDAAAWEFLALYNLASLDVYESEVYRSIGGGGNASKAFHHAIVRRRNVYRGITEFPVVSGDARLLLTEDETIAPVIDDVLFVPLTAGAGAQQAGATRLDGTPAQRAITLVHASTLARVPAAALDGVAVYAPITERYVGKPA